MVEIFEAVKATVQPELPRIKSDSGRVKCDATTDLRRRIAESADQMAVGMHPNGLSWAANWRALKAAGIDAPSGNATDIQAIPGMTKMPADSKLRPGDVVIIGATDTLRWGDSFIVTEDMKAASAGFHKIPNLTKYKDVRIFRTEPEFVKKQETI
jgi:hypothetical protein